MNIIQIKELQEHVVQYIMSFYEHKWDIIVYNVEIFLEDDTLVKDYLKLSFTKENNAWKRESLKYGPGECSKLYTKLWEAFDEKDRWSSFTLEIWKSGKYNYEFHYGPPPRITSDTLDVPFEYTPRDEEE